MLFKSDQALANTLPTNGPYVLIYEVTIPDAYPGMEMTIGGQAEFTNPTKNWKSAAEPNVPTWRGYDIGVFGYLSASKVQGFPGVRLDKGNGDNSTPEQHHYVMTKQAEWDVPATWPRGPVYIGLYARALRVTPPEGMPEMIVEPEVDPDPAKMKPYGELYVRTRG